MVGRPKKRGNDLQPSQAKAQSLPRESSPVSHRTYVAVHIDISHSTHVSSILKQTTINMI